MVQLFMNCTTANYRLGLPGKLNTIYKRSVILGSILSQILYQCQSVANIKNAMFLGFIAETHVRNTHNLKDTHTHARAFGNWKLCSSETKEPNNLSSSAWVTYSLQPPDPACFYSLSVTFWSMPCSVYLLTLFQSFRSAIFAICLHPHPSTAQTLIATDSASVMNPSGHVANDCAPGQLRPSPSARAQFLRTGVWVCVCVRDLNIRSVPHHLGILCR